MIILDTNSLVRWVRADAQEDDAARFQGLLQRAKDGGIAIGLPTPALAEFLVRTDDATTEILAAIERRRGFRVLPFDKRAAHECALLDRFALAAGQKKSAGAPWQKVKVDRQILAIARVHNAHLIVTSDGNLTRMANRVGINVAAVSELPIPDEARQRAIVFMTESAADEVGQVPAAPAA